MGSSDAPETLIIKVFLVFCLLVRPLTLDSRTPTFFNRNIQWFVQYIWRMLFHVTETYRQGVKLSRAEVLAATPMPGQLVIEDWREGSADNRALRVAYLKHPSISYNPNQLHPLFDPVMVRMTAKGFLLIGWQIHATNEGGRWEYKQGWWVVEPTSRKPLETSAQAT